MNALVAAATWLRYVAECSELSPRELAGPSKGVQQHTASSIYGSRALRQAEHQPRTNHQAPKPPAPGIEGIVRDSINCGQTQPNSPGD